MRTDLKVLLDWYISKAFDNEFEFMQRFWIENGRYKLIRLCLSSKYTTVKMFDEKKNEEFDFQLLTEQFLGWVDSLDRSSRFDVLP